MARNEKNAGRKTTYQPDYPERAERYCARYGFKDEELAKEFGVSVESINGWKRKYPKFKKAVSAGKEMNSLEIEHNLRRLAAPHDEVTLIEELKGRGKDKKLVVVGRKTKKNVVCEGAAFRILAADDPKRYGNKIDLGGQMDNPVVITNPERIEELKQIAAAIAAKRIEEVSRQ
jgi:hypothetical protein